MTDELILTPDMLTPERLGQLRGEFKIQLASSQLLAICRALQAKPKCNFLVFGLGNDTRFWQAANPGGRTAFLEDKLQWFITTPGVESHLISYSLCRREWKEVLDKPERLRMTFPKTIQGARWDVMLVDGPMGNNDNEPGRMQSIYAAYELAAVDADVFVHDCEREVERAYCDRYLEDVNLVESLYANSTLRHYRLTKKEKTSAS